jgi:hypothetical protein
MKRSTIHEKMVETRPDFDERIEDYLGSNYKTVLNFWLYFDGLSEAQKDELVRRNIFALRNYGMLFKDARRAITIDYGSYYSILSNSVVTLITYELIAAPILLPEGKALLYVKLLENL